MKIYLPNDADGNVIPSNVKVMYKKNGTKVHVDDKPFLLDIAARVHRLAGDAE